MPNILVVQELDRNTSFVRQALEPEGHNVFAVRAVDEGRRLLDTNKIDLIICAVHLNFGDVFEFLLWLKKHPEHSAIPFVFFCAEPTEFAKHVSPVVVSAAQIIGAADHITMEQFDEQDFSERIGAALNHDNNTDGFDHRVIAQKLQQFDALANKTARAERKRAESDKKRVNNSRHDGDGNDHNGNGHDGNGDGSTGRKRAEQDRSEHTIAAHEREVFRAASERGRKPARDAG